MNPHLTLDPRSVQEHWWLSWQNWSVDLNINTESSLIS